MRLILASGNKHKAEELSELLLAGSIEVVAADATLEVEESGSSFLENAHLKAKAYYERYKLPVVSDDSGLVVKALPDDLGIYSARFGGETLSYIEKMELLMKRLAEVQDCSREAYFTCTLCLYLSPQEIYFFEGRVLGNIGEKMQGHNGFGYDPIFYPKGLEFKQSLAENPEWKMKNSHRSQAAMKLLYFFKERVCQST